MNCARCGTEVRGSHYWREIKGWEQQRSGGGTNYVALRKQTGRVMCEACLQLLRAGVNPGQMDLG